MLDNLRAIYQVMRDVKLQCQKLEKIVDRRLKNILITAYNHVPFYKESMQKAGYNPITDYRGRNDLALLPILDKNMIKTIGLSSFIQEGTNIENCFQDATSGSTGIPFKVFQSPIERSLVIAKWLRVLFLNGYSVFDKVMAPVASDRVNAEKSFIQQLGIMRRLSTDYVHTSAEKMVDQLLKYKPDILYGNRSHLDLMAIELKKQQIPSESLNLKLVIGVAEVIHESNRRLYKKQFGIELIEAYGSVEIGNMAYETSDRDGLHLCEDLIYFEFLDKNGKPSLPGEISRIIVTDLSKKVMPFIRYDHGDLVVFENIDLKTKYPSKRIKRIIGRDNEYVIFSNGTRLSIHDLNVIVEKYPDIHQFRFIQSKEDNIKVLIASSSDYYDSIKEDLIFNLNTIQHKLTLNIIFDVKRVEKIDPDESGKTRTFISYVNI